MHNPSKVASNFGNFGNVAGKGAGLFLFNFFQKTYRLPIFYIKKRVEYSLLLNTKKSRNLVLNFTLQKILIKIKITHSL
jgi:hypothetical protein